MPGVVELLLLLLDLPVNLLADLSKLKLSAEDLVLLLLKGSLSLLKSSLKHHFVSLAHKETNRIQFTWSSSFSTSRRLLCLSSS